MITIRQAILTDLDTLTTLFDAYRVFYEKPSNKINARVFLQERITNQESIIYIAQDAKEKGLGFVQLYPFFSLPVCKSYGF